MYDEGDRVILIHKLCIYTQVKISKYISDVDSICICMYMYINGKQDSLPVIEFAPLPPVSRTIRVEDTFPAFAPTGSHFISFFFLIFIFFSFFFFFCSSVPFHRGGAPLLDALQSAFIFTRRTIIYRRRGERCRGLKITTHTFPA